MASRKLNKIEDHYNEIVKGQKVNGIKTRSAFILMGIIILIYLVFIFALVKYFDSNRIVLESDGTTRQYTIQSMEDTREIEAKCHMKLFYEKFYSFNQYNVETSLKEAHWLGDESINRQYEEFKEIGWYNNIIAKNITQKSYITSIIVDKTQIPYFVRVEGVMELHKDLTVKQYQLNGSCFLDDFTRDYPRNPNGFFIRNWIQAELIEIEN